MEREKAGMRKSYLRCLERWIQSDVVGGINDMMSMIDMMVMTSSPSRLPGHYEVVIAL